MRRCWRRWRLRAHARARECVSVLDTATGWLRGRMGAKPLYQEENMLFLLSIEFWNDVAAAATARLAAVMMMMRTMGANVQPTAAGRTGFRV